MVFGSDRTDTPEIVNPFVCLSIVDDEWKFKITPPAAGGTAFGQTGERVDAVALGETPKYRMELKLKRKLRCRCISVLAGNETIYDNEDYEIDPGDVSKDCDANGFRTLADSKTEFVGYCEERTTRNYGISIPGMPCKCNKDVECEWVTEDLLDTFTQVTGGTLLGNSLNENPDDATLGNLTKKCGCAGSRAPITSDSGVILGYENTMLLSNGPCFDCVMDQLSCGQGSEAAAIIALVMTQLLKDRQPYDSASDICRLSNCDAGGPNAWCPQLLGFEVV